MKLSFSTLACPNWSFPQIVGAAAAHGVQGIDPRGIGDEIDITRVSRFTAELPATIELLRRHNLQIPCLNTSVTLVTAAQERWEMMLEEARRYAALARNLGSRFLRIFAGSAPRGMTHEQAMFLARRHLRQLVKLTAPHSCQVLLETHDEWATSPRMLELLADFDPGEAGALWDIEHPFRKGESPQQTAQMLRRQIHHVHFKDSIASEGKNLPRLLGQGDLPLAQTIAALRGIGYDGWICLETEKRWHPQDAPEPEESIPQFVAFMKSHWGSDEY